MTPYKATPVWVDRQKFSMCAGGVHSHGLTIVYEGDPDKQYRPSAWCWPCMYPEDGTGYCGYGTSGFGDSMIGDDESGGGHSKRSSA
jgi:hypothetical protein